MSTPWESDAAQYPAPAGQQTPVWDPTSGTYQYPDAAVFDPPSQEQWVYVDPSSYSNPYSEAPIYTSGPQPAPAPPVAPPPPPGAPAVSYPHAPAPPPPDPMAAAAATTAQFSRLAPPTSSDRPPPPGAPTHLLPPTAPGPYEGVDVPPGRADPLLAPEYQPEQGELKIKERRSWKTWQLLTAMVAAAVLGMWFNGVSGSTSSNSGISASGGTSGGGYKLPPAAGSSSTTAAVAGAGGTSTTVAGGATTTTSAGSATPTTAAGAGSTTTAPAVLPPASILVPEVQQAGNWNSPAFTIAGGTWNIGWAFQCVPVPTATPTFQIFVVNNGAAPGATPAVTSSAGSGSAVTPLTSAGSQQVIVQTSASCRFALKVTGSGG